MVQAKRPRKGQANARARAQAKSKGQGGFGAGGFYRLCRMLHAYLSAFAFLALLFFAFTGLTLNHPDWLVGGRPVEQVRNAHLPKAELDAALEAPDAGRALAAAVGRQTPVLGRYQSGEILGGEALLRMEGPAGVTDITVQTATGAAEVDTKAAGAVAMLNDLHKGKAAGKAWSWVIDVSAVVLIVMSLLGYILFFSLRFRLVPSLVLTGVSLALLVGMYWVFVA
ncbi:MAG TPA: PepSY-associated TM helix domain-containing protein [Caulobacteraceae bacterium]|jgi:hypothetical protein|nr:PepSY-associated TM helix domain-containing protein [Caulobacteraceae bacterium]